MIAAMERIGRDGMDVLNMSIGSANSTGPSTRPRRRHDGSPSAA